jgi:tetratricopeptide (TPR) repeat protein
MEMMRRSLDAPLWMRLFLPMLLLLLLGVSPRPQVLNQAYRQVQAALRRGDFATAADSLATLASAQPWQPHLWEEAGRAALNAGDYGMAIRHLEQARAVGSLSASGFILLGDAYQLAGDETSTAEIWQALIDRGDAPPGIYLRRANALRQQENIPAAIAVLKALLVQHPGQSAATYELALLLAATDPEAALPYLAQVAELDPTLAPRVESLRGSINTAAFEDEPAYTLLAAGRALASLEEWALAGEAFAHAAAERPDYAEAWAYLGHARERLGEDGQEALDSALTLDPDSLAANLFAALHFAEDGRPEMALLYLHNASRLDPTRAEIQLELGNVLAEMGDLVSARRHYERALSLAGRDPDAWRTAAEYALRYNVDVRELVLPAARQAVLLAPRDPAALDTLGQVYFRMGDPLTARRFFRRALEQDAGYAPAHLHMALYELVAGDPGAARERLELVLELAPGSPAAEQAERLLDSNPGLR